MSMSKVTDCDFTPSSSVTDSVSYTVYVPRSLKSVVDIVNCLFVPSNEMHDGRGAPPERVAV